MIKETSTGGSIQKLILAVFIFGIILLAGCTSPSSAPKGNLNAEVIKPAEVDAKWASARCNDGTPFAFEFKPSPSKSKDWVIFLQGGGFCEDNVSPCKEREKQLTTTLNWKNGLKVQFDQTAGIFEDNAKKNPTFYQANMVFAHYCSSDLWSGSTSEKRKNSASGNGGYFSGRLNVKAMVELLKEQDGLDDSDPELKILFAGNSAGGMGVKANADQMAELLPNASKSGRLRIVDDSGFVPEFDNPNYRTGPSKDSAKEVLAKGYEFWGSKLNPLCEAEQVKSGEPKGICFLGKYAYPFIANPSPEGLGIPMLEQTSSIDKYILELHHISIDNPSDHAAVEELRKNTLDALDGMEWVFSGGEKPYHTLLPNTGWTYGPGPEQRLEDVVGRFWNNESPERVIFGNPEPQR